MYSFFVLGIIPGTNIQITFQGWLDAIQLLIAVFGAVWLFRNRYQIRHQVRDAISRAPLHATQLHQRISF